MESYFILYNIYTILYTCSIHILHMVMCLASFTLCDVFEVHPVCNLLISWLLHFVND